MVSLHIDGNQLKSEVNRVVKDKIKKFYRDDAAKKEILDIWYWKYIQPKMSPVDTGSYKWPPVQNAEPSHTYKQTVHRTYKTKNGESSKDYEYKNRGYTYTRSGYIDISAHHGIKRDAIEHRPGGDVSYFVRLLARDLDIDYDEVSGQGIFDAMDSGDREAFLEDVKKVVVDSMNEGK